MTFKEEIEKLESLNSDKEYIINKGNIPILFTAVHTMEQVREDNSIKLSEPFTKAIALFLNKYCNVNAMVKIKDTGLDANKDNRDEFKTELIRFIKDNKIKLVIDLHGANENRNFDIEFGTLDDLSIDFSTVKELEESFMENGINNITYNNPFKGGAITQYVFGLKETDVIQLEINRKFRDINNIDDLKKLCNSLEKFIKQYSKL